MKNKVEISAGGIVYKKLKSNVVWLIGQHSKHKGWGFPKGFIGDNFKDETMETAALREVEEEGGVKAKIVDDKKTIKMEYLYRFKGTLVIKTVYYYLMEYVSGDPKNHDWEMSDAKFVSADQVRKTLSYKSDREAFEKAVKLLKS
jgi:ADP-ribose pyrophosphatase YjhB (NUDIX family)